GGGRRAILAVAHRDDVAVAIGADLVGQRLRPGTDDVLDRALVAARAGRVQQIAEEFQGAIEHGDVISSVAKNKPAGRSCPARRLMSSYDSWRHAAAYACAGYRFWAKAFFQSSYECLASASAASGSSLCPPKPARH